jgi:predicted DNA-binding mobile mystery protein A
MNEMLVKLVRRQIEAKLERLQILKSIKPPRSGWLKAIRESLGMTAKQAGNRAGTSQQNWTKAENNETKGNVSISTLNKLANAMGCEFVYALIPTKGTLNDFLLERARNIANHSMSRTYANMKLEQQEISKSELEKQTEELAMQIVRELKSNFWEDLK